MTEFEREQLQIAKDSLAALKRIETLLMYVANNTSDAVPYDKRSDQYVTRFYPTLPVVVPVTK